MSGYEYSETHIREVFSHRDPVSAKRFREEHFDRWLNEERAKVWEEGLAEGAYRGTENLIFAENPYRKEQP